MIESKKKLDRQNVEDIFALSPVQEGMLFHYLSEPESEMYIEQLSFSLSGKLDTSLLKKAWDIVAEGNEMLRTVFRWENLDKPVQVVLKMYSIPVAEFDLTALDKEKQASKLDEILENDRKRRMDISSEPFRITLCKLSEQEMEMVLCSYHIIFDGWSNGILLKEFIQVYNDLYQGKEPQRPVKNKYKEFIKWNESQDKDKTSEYWKNYFEGFNTKTLLPVDHKRQGKSTQAKYYTTALENTLTDRINYFCKNQEVTVATLLFSAWGVLLQKYNDSNDVLFGTTVSGRSSDIKGVENIVGLFINTPPLRIRSNKDESIRDFLIRTDKMIRDREDYESSPLTEIKPHIGLESNEEPFDSIVVIENYPLDKLLNNSESVLNITIRDIFEMTNYDITVVISTFDKIELRFIYDNTLYEFETIKTLTSQLTNVIEGLISNPEGLVSQIGLLTEKEQKQILFDFNHNKLDYPLDKTICGLLEERVAKSPDEIAVISGDQTCTYKELNERANRIARLLVKKGVTKETVVGIMLDRSIEMVACLMAILKAGGAYLPIDSSLPEDRIIYMLEDANAKVVITDRASLKGISFTSLQGFGSNRDIRIMVTEQRGHIEDFNSLPIPDRSLLDLTKYKDKIGMASVNNCISLQTTRGCPYKCLYCHKIWSKHHVHRTAENIFNEIEYYYKNGVRNFAVIDDCFNLDMENSSRLFKLIIKHGMKIQLFFPNGLRGDILTPEYIDLMVEAGTRGINLSLETASPRLQKLLQKNLNLDKFREVINYITEKHPEIILELATMHGFPTETEEEAMMTLNFIKETKWLHFPYVHILKIFPNTEMEAFALENGIKKSDIMKSKDLAFHELPETLPFPKSFTRKYQASFLNEYFLNKERLKHVLPVQLKILEEADLAQKYNAYLPTDIKTVSDIIKFAQMDAADFPSLTFKKHDEGITIFDRPFERKAVKNGAKKVLFLDLSQHFSSHNMLYKVTEQPLGHLYLMTYLKKEFGDDIDGRVCKSGVDFDNYEELRALIEEYKPDMIGIRTLTFFKEFFHETVSHIRHWGFAAPIIVGGPYASSDYDTILKDKNVDLVLFGEGEYILGELVGKMLHNGFKIPEKSVLQQIKGIAYTEEIPEDLSREVLLLDQLSQDIEKEAADNLPACIDGSSLAYVMYTSGSTGKPKGVMIEHRQVNNCIFWMQDKFNISSKDTIVQRTNLTFDPSVWEIIWPLYQGAKVKIITAEQSRDAEFLIKLMAEDRSISMMYCPSSLVNAMTYLLNARSEKTVLKMPWLIIGAEPINMGVVKNFYSYYEGRIVNTYGPTECTINNTYYDLDRDDIRSVVPIGKPVANNNLYILSKDMQPMPLKMPGEIYIAGDSIARGYINNPQKTSQSFIKNPFGTGMLYKTGDIGRWLEDGIIEIMGRVDEQVKIRGYRIELGEIEAAVLSNPAVKECLAIVKDSNKLESEVRVCKNCGITSKYPNISINDDNICNICENADQYIKYAEQYFGTMDDLKDLLQEVNKDKKSKYDCILVYACERVATYALYKLKDMGLNILTATYDPGHISKESMENIKRTTAKIGVDHIVLTHKNSDSILRESLKSAHTMCKGCIHTSSSLAGQYAYENGIKVVIGETLSRGQIIETKLYKFFQQGITDVKEIEEGLLRIQKSVSDIDKNIYELIDVDAIKDKSLYDEVKFVDFYRYCDTPHSEMISFLNSKDDYWESLGSSAIYSTDCFICQVGDYNYYKEKGYHYMGGAKSWEKRLGHLTMKELEDDLTLTISQKEYENFLSKIKYVKDTSLEKLDTKYICAYLVQNEKINISELREYLKERLPRYMIPSSFVVLDKIPLTSNGKVDRNALPEPGDRDLAEEEIILPSNEIEENLAEIWQKILGIDRVGVNENFFDLGGNSLLLVRLQSQIDKQYPGKISIADLFGFPTVSKLAELIKSKEDEAPKAISLPVINFPSEFFIGQQDIAQGSVFKFQFKDLIYSRLKRIAEEEGVLLCDILLGMKIYLLSEITGTKEIAVQATGYTMNQLVSLDSDLNHIGNFSELFSSVSEKRKGKNEVFTYQYTEVKNVTVDKGKTGVIPFFANRKMVDQSNTLTGRFDIVIEMYEENNSVQFICEYNFRRLRQEKVKELIDGYIGLIESLADKYTFQK